MDLSINKNWIDKEEYPQSAAIDLRCVNMVADLWHAPAPKNGQAVGTNTIGSSEACMLGGMAMKWRWRKRMEAAGKPTDKPNLVCGPVQICWHADDDAALAQQFETVEGFIDHVSENRGVTAYHGIEVELAGPKADLFAAIREVGALMQTAGVKNTQVNEWVYRSLAALNDSDEKAAEQLAESPTIKAELL